MKKKQILKLIVVSCSAMLWGSTFAQGRIASTTDTALSAKVDARQFVGAWKIDKLGSVILIRLLGEDQLNVRGQDSASVWDARCIRKNNVLFDCAGTGEKFPNKPFLFHSTMQVVDDILVDEWRVDGRNDAGVLEKMDGIDRFERIRAAK